MAQEKGLVTGVANDGWAEVVADRKDACDYCGAKRCCVSLGSGAEIVIKARNRAGAKEGDMVSIDLSSGAVLKGAAVLYLMPLAGLMLGVIIGTGVNERLGIGETIAAVAFGFAGLFLGFLVTGFTSRRMAVDGRLTPVITRVIRPSFQGPDSLTAVDPVCKTVILSSQAADSLTYKDKNYYFCSSSCRESFMSDPQKYL